jgi:hypothetical protein
MRLGWRSKKSLPKWLIRFVTGGSKGEKLTKVEHLHRTSPFYLPSLREQNPSSAILILGCPSQRNVCDEYAEAEKRHERTLEAVACTPWFGLPVPVCHS